MRKLKAREVYLVASGDLRLSANRECWQAQAGMEAALGAAARECGYRIVRAHPFKAKEGHGFISSQREGLSVFAGLDPDAKLIVAEAVWQYSHHVLPGLTTHRGPILTVANWSGQWPGLVGMLNLNGSMTAAGVRYSALWAEDFSSEVFIEQFGTWLRRGKVSHPTPHVKPLSRVKVPAKARAVGTELADELKRTKAIMGIFDEGCMGMFNAVIPDRLLMATGVFKERLSQSALYYAATQVKESEARVAYRWLVNRGMRFVFGKHEAADLTLNQVLWQLRMYIAAVRIADEFGCAAIGIQYQQGLKDLLPASDLAEGLLNDHVRPPVRSADGKRVLYAGRALPHFNEVDECAGLDAILTNRVQSALRQPVENTLHDVRWGDWDRSGTTTEYVWVLEISGSVPPSHFARGLRDAVGCRQPAMYFRLGGATVKGISKPGEIVWSRVYLEDDRLKMDLGRAKSIALPLAETERRWNSTTPQWPLMHAVLYGVTRDQFMAKHKANHIQVVYSNGEAAADLTMLTKASMARALGLEVNVCGTRKDGGAW
ncbi:MAG: fucose isomerase [Candidatus Coatesbacteria bacterium]